MHAHERFQILEMHVPQVSGVGIDKAGVFVVNGHGIIRGVKGVHNKCQPAKLLLRLFH